MRLRDDQKGIAAVEMALSMLILVPLLLVLVEAVNALNQYGRLQDAAREGARMASREDGDTSRVEELVDNLTRDIPGSDPIVNAETDFTDEDHKKVTVEVSWDYSSLLFDGSDTEGNSLYDSLFGGETPTLTAACTMPIP